MKVFYDPVQKNHILSHEIIAGKKYRHHEKRARIDVILKQLKKNSIFEFEIPEKITNDILLTVHDEGYIKFLQKTELWAKNDLIWPYVFPCDNRIEIHEPVTPLTAGYYCFDVGTPIMHDTWISAIAAASGAYAAAKHTLKTSETSYALARPPGHHASQNKFGGYCYLNNAAIAAKYLSQYDKVLIIDFDFHHGNGTQSIFYDSNDVFYFSLHAEPNIEYPYFTGFIDEIGIDDGINFNLNVPLKPFCGFEIYYKNFLEGLNKIHQIFNFKYIIISAGFDIADGDPLGHFALNFANFETLGKEIKKLNKHITIIQEGGYLVNNLGRNVESFLSAFI